MISAVLDADGGVVHRVALVADVTELRRRDGEIWHMPEDGIRHRWRQVIIVGTVDGRRMMAVVRVVRGADGADRLDGGDGSDLLIGGIGADMMIGGMGDDRYWINGADAFWRRQGFVDAPVAAGSYGADSVSMVRML